MVSKSIKLLVIASISLCVAAAVFIICYELDSRRIPVLAQDTEPVETALTEVTPEPLSYTPSSTPAPTPFAEPSADYTENKEESGIAIPSPTSTPAKKEEVRSSSPPSANRSSTLKPGTITIRGKTFSLKRGVDEETLKKDIGWMESSAAPGEQGTCVVMGHRNTQFRILRLVEKGDVITIIDFEGVAHTYTVVSGEIIENGENLRFEATDEVTLVLVTCYPFFYQGHAPHRYIVTAIAP